MGRKRTAEELDSQENIEELRKKIGKLYRASELAKALKMTRATILNYIREGLLKAVLVGRTYLIKEKDLDEFLEKIFGEW